MLVYGTPPFTVPEKVGFINLDVGTAVNLEERGIKCSNSGRLQTAYFSEKGRLVEKRGKIENYRGSLMQVPLTGLGRVIDFVSRCAPWLDVLLDGNAYDIYNGTILEENHQMKERDLENLINKSTLLKLKNASSKKCKPLFTAVATER